MITLTETEQELTILKVLIRDMDWTHNRKQADTLQTLKDGGEVSPDSVRNLITKCREYPDSAGLARGADWLSTLV